MSDETISVTPPKEAKQPKMRFDDASLIEYAGRYLDTRAHEPTVWLGRYTREKCNQNLNILAAKAKKLGFAGSYGHFHKILTGAAFNTREGKAPGSVENLIGLVDKLKHQSMLEEMAGKVPFVETQTYMAISGFIDTIRAVERVCKFGIIVGPTGSQKTASFKHYKMIHNSVLSTQETRIQQLDKVKQDALYNVAYMEAPDKPSLQMFIEEWAMCYGVPLSQARRSGRAKIREQVKSTSTIIIDNCQRLYRPDAMFRRSVREEKEAESLTQQIFNYLQKVQDDTSCAIILCFTPDFIAELEKKMEAGYFEQFEGRAGGRDQFLVLPNYAPDEDVLAIANAFHFRGAEAHLNYLSKIAQRPGRIRILFDKLQTARQIANEDNTDLTFEVFKKTLSPKLTAVIDAEIQAEHDAKKDKGD